VRLGGCQAFDPQLQVLLAAASGLEVDARGPLAPLGRGADVAAPEDGAWAGALGAALTLAPAVAVGHGAPNIPSAAAGAVALAA
jgi:hypothetical protein